MKYKIVKKVWGEEKWIVNTDKYCGKLLYLKEGYRCSRHYHIHKDETFYLLKGRVLFELNDNKFELNEGDSVRIKPNTWHRFTGLEDSIIIEFSTHHEDDDTIRSTNSTKVFGLKSKFPFKGPKEPR